MVSLEVKKETCLNIEKRNFQRKKKHQKATMWYRLLLMFFRIWLHMKANWSGIVIFEESYKWTFECTRFYKDKPSTGVSSLISFFLQKAPIPLLKWYRNPFMSFEYGYERELKTFFTQKIKRIDLKEWIFFHKSSSAKMKLQYRISTLLLIFAQRYLYYRGLCH